MKRCEVCDTQLRRGGDENASHYKRRKTCREKACVAELKRRKAELRREVEEAIG